MIPFEPRRPAIKRPVVPPQAAAGKPPRLSGRDYSGNRFRCAFGARPPAIALDAKPQKAKAAPAVRPNVGLEVEYRRKLFRLVDGMARSYARFLKACYRANPPAMAQDVSRFSPSNDDGKSDIALDSAASELEALLAQLFRQWERRFNQRAPDLARWFATSTLRRSDDVLRAILRDVGYSVRFKMTAMMRDVARASIEENVGLIRSIPQEFHTAVQGMVMRSVSRGRDLKSLVDDLQNEFGVTRRRAEFIALDQNNKATSALTAARQTEVGIEEGIWQHSHAGKVPRRTHLANDGKRFSILKGWFDPDKRVRRRIWPGELIRCRCTWRPVVKGFS